MEILNYLLLENGLIVRSYDDGFYGEKIYDDVEMDDNGDYFYKGIKVVKMADTKDELLPKLNVFIATSPIGKTKKQLLQERVDVKNELQPKYKEKIVIADAILSDMQNYPLWYLGYTIQMISHCDLVYFKKGFDSDEACLIVQEVCAKFGVKIVYEV